MRLCMRAGIVVNARPALHVLSARQENRIEEDGAILMARLDRHYIQDPVFPSKAKVKSVQDQNQGSSWQAKPESEIRSIAGLDENADSCLEG